MWSASMPLSLFRGLLLWVGLGLASVSITDAAVLTPFSVRYTTNDTGDITFAANTLMTAPASDPDSANAQNGVGTKLNNNDFIMTYVDVDTDPATFNSSFARLNMPSGSQVLFAGLYWGARTNNSFPTGLTKNRALVKFKAPGDLTYRDLTGTVIGTGGSDYQSFVDVTSIVRGSRAGAYTVANVQAVKDAADYYAGWSMVVVYRAPDAPARNLTVFDGYGTVRSSDPSIDISIGGFVTPPRGPVNATLGFVTYEGDLGSTGDKVFFDGGLGPVQLSNSANPPNNFFNSTISDRSSLASTKDPNYVNQLGFDANLVAADGIIANGASTAKMRMTTGGETYYPGVFTSVIELFAPEVTIHKSVTDINGGTVVSGDVLNYTITVTNAAGAQDNAVNVILDDLIPANTAYKANSLSVDSVTKTDAIDSDQAEFINGNAVRFQLGTGAGGVDAYGSAKGGSLSPNQSTTVTFQVVVGAGITSDTLIENTATATYAGATSKLSLTATDFANIAGSASADLAVTKTNSQNIYTPGNPTTYTIVVTNNGPSAVIGATVLDVLPNEVRSATWSAVYGPGSSGPASGTGDINAVINLASGDTATFTVSAQTRLEAFGNLSNTVVVNPPAGVSDPDFSNNTATDIDIVSVPSADLRVSKTVDNSAPHVGGTVQFTMEVNNDGPSTAKGVVLSDVLPTGFTLVSSSPSSGTTYSTSTGLWNVGTLFNGGKAKLVLSATVNPSGNYQNSLIVTESGVSDPNPGNNNSSVQVEPASADLSVNKSVDKANPAVGDTVQFTVVVSNQGPSQATGVTLADQLPSGYSLESATASSGTSYVAATGIWTVGTLANGASATLRINAKVKATGPYGNTASVSQSDQPDPNTSNDSSTVSTNPISSADLAVSKQVDIANPPVGDTVQFTVLVTNQGPSQATGVTLADQLPSGYSLESATASSGTSYLAATGIWTVGALANGGSATLSINARVNATGPYGNTASVSHSDQPDPDTSNDSSTASTNPVSADLAVSKRVDNANPVVGETVQFTVVVSNQGPSQATGVTLADQLPSGYSLESATASSGTSYVATTGIWTVGTLANGGSATLSINAKVNATGPYGNTASLSHSDQPDPHPGNNTAVVDVGPNSADLAVSKQVDIANPPVGDTVQFTVVVSNQGPSQATGVTLADQLPSGYSLESATASSGTSYVATTGIWTVGTLANGGSATLSINARVNATGPYGNTASVSHSDQPDPDTSNDSSTASTNPVSADLAVSKQVDIANPPVGGTVQFTVVVSNQGPSQATEVTLADQLPSGYSLESATASSGTSYVAATGIWTVGTLANGASATLRINAKVKATGPYGNTASVSRSDQPDPNTSNDSSTVSTNPISSADLAVSKQVDIANPPVGDTVQFTVVVTNQGPSQATGVTLADQLPSGYSLKSATASSGTSYLAATGIWTVGTLANGASATLRMNATVNTTGNYLNQASVTNSNQPDPNPGNNSAEVAVGPVSADLAVSKQVNVARPAVNDLVQFVITVSNNGPNRATGVRVLDNLPSGYQFVSATPGGAYDATSGQWTIGDLVDGAAATLRINARVLATGSYENSVTVAASDQPDPDTSNNISTVSIGPISADLMVSKQVDNPSPQVGDQVQFLVVVTNKGPNQATGVNLLDNLPSGFTFVSAVPSTGTQYASTSGQWSVGNLATGSSASLRINALVKSRGSYQNSAEVSHSDQPDPDASNNRAEVAVGPVTADLVVTKQVNNPSPLLGSSVIFTMTVTNEGPNSATNVSLIENLPSGYSFIGATPGNGTSYDPVSGEWAVGFLPQGGLATLSITATVNASGDQTNSVKVTHSDQPGSDSGSTTSTVTTGPQSADLEVSKSVDNPAPYIGETVQFTIMVTNRGPDDTFGLTLLDNLPSGYRFISATASHGAYDASNGQWTVGSLADNGTETLTITAVVLGSGMYNNGALVSYSAMPDPDGRNNESSVVVSPQANPSPPPNPIPTLNELGRLMLVLALLGLAWKTRRVILK